MAMRASTFASQSAKATRASRSESVAGFENFSSCDRPKVAA
jgi:hypothetical protein